MYSQAKAEITAASHQSELDKLKLVDCERNLALARAETGAHSDQIAASRNTQWTEAWASINKEKVTINAQVQTITDQHAIASKAGSDPL